MKIFIACGGTGGHFYPGLTVAVELKKQKHEVTVLLSGKHTEKFEAICKSKKIPTIVSTRYSRSTQLRRMPLLILKVVQNLITTWGIIRREKPEAILGMGGFANFSIIMAKFLKTKTKLFTHEGNAVVGKTNLILSRFATKSLLSLNVTNSEKLKCESLITGFPVRKRLIEESSVTSKHTMTKPEILITGGSQGAQSMNTLLAEALINYPRLDEVSITHSAGNEAEQLRLQEIYGKTSAVKVFSFLDDIGLFYAKTDLAIVRSGASTLFELALFKVAPLAIPLPWAADNHQFYNAESINKLTESEIIIIMNQGSFSSEKIYQTIDLLLDQPHYFKQVGELLNQSLSGISATKAIVEAITLS